MLLNKQQLSQYHRIIELFELEGTFKGHLVQFLYSEQVQPDLGCLQGQVIHHLCGQPVPVLHHPRCKKTYLLYPV